MVSTEVPVGSFLLAGPTVGAVWPTGSVGEDVEEAVRAAVALGPERIRQQDIKLGIRQLADVAVRRLSPVANDPSTAAF